MLSLENAGDVVPLTAGSPGEATPTHVTVSFDSGSRGIRGDHDLGRYAAGAAAVDASKDPVVKAADDEVKEFLTGDGEDPALAGQTFQITRDRGRSRSAG